MAVITAKPNSDQLNADTAAAARSLRQSRQIRKVLGLIPIYLLMVVIAALIVLPLVWMLSTSFKPQSQWFTSGTIEWVPRTFTLENYQKLFNNPATPIGNWFFNSVFIALVSTALVLTVDSLAAYAYARMEFPGRKFLFGFMLMTLFLPGMMFLVPNFLTIASLHLLNSWIGVVLPGIAGVFGVFFLRQFFESIPLELEEAAAIDGANRFQIFFMVVLPLAKPALATLGILTFLGSWNDFLWPLLVLRDPHLQTLPPGLRTLQGAYSSQYGLMLAGAVIVAVPVLIIYIALQRYIVQSVASTGLKG
ncbi:MAG: carbohydrate ABC transporter permease [Chloroflexota bacterium]|nr:carbohydrate ABC transporter permease [Chloroflexota bacterium]